MQTGVVPTEYYGQQWVGKAGYTVMAVETGSAKCCTLVSRGNASNVCRLLSGNLGQRRRWPVDATPPFIKSGSTRALLHEHGETLGVLSKMPLGCRRMPHPARLAVPVATIDVVGPPGS